ncbi:hypothetical protein A9F13_11g00946 [Clavispora lusitaniae]|uniref:Potassium channel tetramerisation-type BTB domain-containing protein n=1 Tax=Clavispora lusitaniae TaxID=36911 RepID=A0AA91T175_CLALS|nr:hypothetical protein A9F13_11g00946 [Clavispora lusitaniae]
MSIPVEVSEEFDPSIPAILPHDKVYLIQVGYKLFKLSGASLSSDAPSYFTTYFLQEENKDSVLFIDRSPTVFEKIYNHLQGYHIKIENDYEFVYLLQDSYYFCLKRLQRSLEHDNIFANIGGKSFKIPKSLFVQSGNYPNFFSVHYESLFVDNRRLILAKNTIRPPPQMPPSVPNRSAELFSDLLEISRGNTVSIRNDEHRALLIKECRYYRFVELEQRILKHHILFNPITKETEIIMNLRDLQSRGIVNRSRDIKTELQVQYCRPHIRKEPLRNLIIQIDSTPDSEVKLILNKHTNVPLLICTNSVAHSFVHVFRNVAPKFTSDLENNTLGLLCGLSKAKVVINDQELKEDWFADFFESTDKPDAKRKKSNENRCQGDFVEFRLIRSLWRVLIRGDLGRLHAVSIEGSTDQVFLNKSIDFI